MTFCLKLVVLLALCLKSEVEVIKRDIIYSNNSCSKPNRIVRCIEGARIWFEVVKDGNPVTGSSGGYLQFPSRRLARDFLSFGHTSPVR